MHLAHLTDDDLNRIERHAYARGDSTVQALAAGALDATARVDALDELVSTLTRLTGLLDTDQPLTPGGHVDALRLADDARRIAEGLA